MSILKWARSSAVVLFALAVLTGVALLFTEPLQVGFNVTPGIDIGLRFDVLSVILLAFVASICWLVATYSIRNLAGQERIGRFGALLMTATASLALLVTGASLPVIALGWTVSGWVLSRLVLHTNNDRSRRAAGLVARRMLLSDALLWVGVIVAIALLPTVNRAEFTSVDFTAGSATVVALLLAAAAIVRSGLFPLQGWLPETAEAPSPVSAFLHAGIVNGAGILGALAWPLFRAAPAVLLGLVLVGIASVAIGTWAARVRSDVKGQLACSTTAQMGYMTIQLGVGLPAAAIAHLIAHGYYKAWLFLRAGGAVTRARSRSRVAVTRSRKTDAVAVGVSAITVAIGAAIAAPAAVWSVSSLGSTALLPLLLALATAVVGVVAVLRSARSSALVVAMVAGAAGLAVGTYQWLLFGWEGLLASSIPLGAAWSSAVGILLLAVVALAAIGIAIGAQWITSRPAGVLAVRVGATALAPHTRKWIGVAAWPTTAASDRTSAEQSSVIAIDTVQALVEATAAVCAPNWPLRTFVAANPMAPFERFPFPEAARIAGQRYGANAYLPLPSYAALHASGRISEASLQQAVNDHRAARGESTGAVPDPALVAQLIARAAASGRAASAQREPTRTRLVDGLSVRSSGAALGDLVAEHAAIWCQRAWAAAQVGETDPFGLWRTAAATPAYDRAVGVRGVSELVAQLPTDPAAALVVLLDKTGLPANCLFDYVCDLLLAGPGWAAHAHWRGREAGTNDALVSLIALRCALDVFVAGTAAGGSARLDQHHPHGAESLIEPDSLTPMTDWMDDAQIWQAALESTYRNELVSQLRGQVDRASGAQHGDATGRPDAQLMFCIDVRSERFRRAIESTSGDYRTFGFAGFFGAALQYQPEPGISFDQCPVLIKPSHVIRGNGASVDSFRSTVRTAVLATTSAPVTPLLVAEAAGLLSGVASLCQTVLPRRWNHLMTQWGAVTDRWGSQPLTESRGTQADESGLPIGLDTDARVALAAGALGAIGLVDSFAPLIVVCAHAATTENNAFAAGYDCGACGGNGGHVNARTLVDAINDREVRRRLADQGIQIPDDTVAIAAAHNTTTDVVELDPAYVPNPQHREQVARLVRDLGAARESALVERLPLLPHSQTPGRTVSARAASVERRALDWSQPFPEWGLAGNAAFVIGPRALTSNLDLAGRVFLHSYNPDLDPNNDILATLLTAPAVVTQWINSQYYFSSVDPQRFGAGDKTTHNVVGDVGVVSGAHGDLKLGLPWQAAFSADPRYNEGTGMHEPLRLLIVAWASPAAVSSVIADHANLQDLFANGWASLAAIDPPTGQVWRLTPSLQWRPWVESNDAAAVIS